jgi:hypothetical protein
MSMSEKDERPAHAPPHKDDEVIIEGMLSRSTARELAEELVHRCACEFENDRPERECEYHRERRETMQRIMQVLGPEAVCVCAGCQWETNEAIRLLKEAGIEYQHRKALAKPAHDPAREQLGNETTHVCPGCGRPQ